MEQICACLNLIHPKSNGISFSEQIIFVKDRPGHDFRYAIDISKIKKNLNWEPKINFKEGLIKTVNWYIDNTKWWKSIQNGTYNQQRLGLNL